MNGWSAFFCFISFSGYQCVRFIFRQFVTICTNLISMWTVELLDLKQFLPNFNHTFNHSSHIARIFFWVYGTSSGLRLYFVEFCQIICIVTTVTYHGMNYHVHCMCKKICAADSSKNALFETASALFPLNFFALLRLTNHKNLEIRLHKIVVAVVRMLVGVSWQIKWYNKKHIATVIQPSRAEPILSYCRCLIYKSWFQIIFYWFQWMHWFALTRNQQTLFYLVFNFSGEPIDFTDFSWFVLICDKHQIFTTISISGPDFVVWYMICKNITQECTIIL